MKKTIPNFLITCFLTPKSTINNTIHTVPINPPLEPVKKTEYILIIIVAIDIIIFFFLHNIVYKAIAMPTSKKAA